MAEATNWIIFQSDSHHHHLLGCAGHPIVRTPSLDGLAARGTRFDAAYCASPLCLPSRAALATGRFPHQTGYWDNAHGYDGRIDSWMKRLRDQDHQVASVGKLHYLSRDQDHGFSEEIIALHGLPGVTGMNGLLRYDDTEQPEPKRWWNVYCNGSGVGDTEYMEYDHAITNKAVAWLAQNASRDEQPWVLVVSFVAPHPPFTVPQRLWDLYPVDEVPLPVAFRPQERPEHPAIQHLRRIYGWHDMRDEDVLKRVVAGYCGLITHVDEQIGKVLAAAESLGLTERTRCIYFSDHGESHGQKGLFGKCHLYDDAARVPMVAAGPDIPVGRVERLPVSLVDIFPTLVSGVGGSLAQADTDLPGRDLFDTLGGACGRRHVFAEYHGSGSRSGAFMIRDERFKLIRHVGMESQLFDLADDPSELNDLVRDPAHDQERGRLSAVLSDILDPDATDIRAKGDQRTSADRYGGRDAILKRPNFMITTPPTASGRRPQ